ncbi:MAG: uroporphyrinogen decarboxylase family protein [Thermoleophilia bacterium]
MAVTDKPWAEMTPEEKQQYRLDSWLKAEGVEFDSPEAEEAYKARVTRLTDALTLRATPDRVPVYTFVGSHPAYWAGLTPYEAMHDYERAAQAWIDYNLDVQADALVAPLHNPLPAKAFELLDYKTYVWPGHGLEKHQAYQYNEAEFMREDEYDALIEDPTGYLLRTYLPRIAGVYTPFVDFPSPIDLVEMPFAPNHMIGYANPALIEAFQQLAEVGKETAKWANTMFPVLGRLQAAGLPPYDAAGAKAPFDFLGDTLRGTRSMMLDMYRQPEKVLEACDRLVPLIVKWVTERAKPEQPPLVFIPLHKGADGFMSDEQFRTFYWPSLKKVVEGLVAEGFIPRLFAEGKYESRLEVIKDVPRGSVLWHFDQMDMGKAKKALKDVACIAGNVSPSLYYTGTPEEVTAYCRKVIDEAGEGGGLILDIAVVADEAKQENLKAMVEAAKEYGVY